MNIEPFIGGPNMRWPCGNPATDLAALDNLIGMHLSEDFEEYPYLSLKWWHCQGMKLMLAVGMNGAFSF